MAILKQAVTLEQRLTVAREAKATADAVLESAFAGLATADASGHDSAIRKAEDAVADARRASERYGRSLAHLEREIEQEASARADALLVEHRHTLKSQIKARVAAGKAIDGALNALAAAVAQLEAADSIILTLPVTVRGDNAVHGHNFGGGPLRAHLFVELRQRGIVGSPSSMAFETLANWLRVGNDTFAMGLVE